jgi:small subunit ribosomal protein S3
MIERKFVAEKLKEFQIQEYIGQALRGVGHSHTKLQRTPLGEKIIVFASKPGLVVGRSGENIKKLTKTLKKRFGLENPQIEISEIQNINLDANIVAENIATALERFGSSKFKAIGHKAMESVMKAGGLGVEIRMSGKIPSSRAKSWRFYQGYLKKCGDSALTEISIAYAAANLKSGTIGVQVRIMPPEAGLSDKITLKTETDVAAEAVQDQKSDADKKETDNKKDGETKKEKKPRKKSKKPSKQEEDENKVQEEVKEDNNADNQ